MQSASSTVQCTCQGEASHVRAAEGTGGDGAVIAAKPEVTEAAPLKAVSPAVAVIELRSGARQEARTATHQVVWWA